MQIQVFFFSGGEYLNRKKNYADVSFQRGEEMFFLVKKKSLNKTIMQYKIVEIGGVPLTMIQTLQESQQLDHIS